ncbi:PepSY-like domain-containing protein [Flavobacterium soyae]|uniref:PepSY-like domain-containing protein n=1 Tax=Flavobacterium soyae TaxID=2903098 RepID=A0ABZ2UGE3_9FLAO|nr:PepSY-like domain-containing protein [Flavobacterium soyae]MCD9576150.1 PepSY-like domain-containing protein [Flavobacterium soyae]
MKKLAISAAILLGSLSISAIAAIIPNNAQTTVSVQTEYTEISTDVVPAAVKTALQTAYPNAKLEKAYVNDKKEYKLEISVGDQKATVYSDVNGNWLKI